MNCDVMFSSESMNWATPQGFFDDLNIVLLIPARTDTSYFHDYIYKQDNVELRFIRGRLKFGDGKNSAPFPSMLVIYNG